MGSVADIPCPGAERFDVAKIKAKNAEEAAMLTERISEFTSITPLPPGAEEAATRIRVRVPATAMWWLDTRMTLWKDAGETWQIATNNVQTNSPPPPPKPPPPPGEDGNSSRTDPPTPEPPPYLASPLDAASAARLDAFLADPCFINGPDNLRYSVPLIEIDAYGREEWICPPDSASYMAEVKQAGLPTRYISHACYMDFAVSELLTAVSYMSAAPPEAEQK